MKKIYLFLLVIFCLQTYSFAQNIGINTDGSAPNPNAMLDIKSNTKGLLIPRTSTTSRLAIPNTKGLLVYDSTTSSFWYDDGVAWQEIGNSAAINGTVNYLPKYLGSFYLGNSQIVDNGNYVGIGTTNPVARFQVADSSVLFSAVGDVPALPHNVPQSGNGRRFLWYADKAALRAGYTINDEWNSDKIGNYSVGFGTGTIASGIYSLAIGYSSTASGIASSALGFNNTASGDYSFATGYGSNSKGKYSFTTGNNSYAYGDFSASIGELCTTNAVAAFAEGYSCLASGGGSIAMGEGSNARGDFSFAEGFNCNANSRSSVALGEDVTANGISSFATGLSNVTSGKYAFASGTFATASGMLSIAMGTNITASGNGSMIFGSNLFDAGHKGNAMFGDTDPWNAGSVGSGTDDQMICRFNNGYYFITGGNTNRTGMQANHGDNSWSIISDSTKKEKLIPVNGEDLLKKISNFKLTTWNYKGQDSKIFRHYGPMAQDFHNAFGHDAIGTIGNDTLINQADFLGVSFTAIQALEKRTEKIEQQQEQIEDLKKENASLADNNQKMQDQIKALLSSYAVLNKKVETLASVGNKINSIAKK